MACFEEERSLGQKFTFDNRRDVESGSDAPGQQIGCIRSAKMPWWTPL